MKKEAQLTIIIIIIVITTLSLWMRWFADFLKEMKYSSILPDKRGFMEKLREREKSNPNPIIPWIKYLKSVIK